jgi:hypothetical protein
MRTAPIPPAPAHRPYVPPVYRPRQETLINLKDEYNREMARRRRTRALARAAVILGNFLLALAIGALVADAGYWFAGVAATVLILRWLGNRYLRTRH